VVDRPDEHWPALAVDNELSREVGTDHVLTLAAAGPGALRWRAARYWRRQPIEEGLNVRWWLRSLATGAAIGFAIGLVIGGTLGRVFMRLLFFAREDALGFETAMGAIVGEFTGPGTAAIYGFGAFAGIVLGIAYALGRALLPSGTLPRTIVFTLGTTLFMLGQIVRSNREDFSFLPVTLSLLLIIGSVVLTAVPVPLLLERLVPDLDRRPNRLATGLVALGMTGFAVFAVTGILIAYAA
jgi:hypothetical protein